MPVEHTVNANLKLEKKELRKSLTVTVCDLRGLTNIYTMSLTKLL